ncbi:MAG: tRNA (N(6)-L-threonylcarbamoyladenosine(37)-C(2))-methylthiotransferase MtaB [Ignavibacteriae bacterium]|nr:tRNA (N(6)-L-threonylcarbamoyladenosine(37)-C(2))-methylthiotransferase MtaB [Ignavibacteriota bacterium]
MKSVALHTLGCKLNYSETSTLAKQFEDKGMKLSNYGEKSDIFVLNTCSVTDNADKECRQIIRSVLRNNPETYVIVTGCYAQLQPGEIAGIEGVDLILGSKEKLRLFEYLEDVESPSCIFKEPESKIFVSEVGGKDDEIKGAFSADIDSRTRAFLKIQDGCDYGCSFCTIPMARGVSRSLPLNEVVDNAKKIIDSGYKEIILTGVNTGDYRYIAEGKTNKLIDVLLELEKLEIERVRISSIEPNLLTDEVISLVKSSDKICNHFHIPLQSGDADILKLMRRRYNLGFFRELIEKVIVEIPDVGVGIDVIIGFPGETDENFKNTYDFLNSLQISYLHVFSYSERKNTLAVTMSGKVDIAKRKQRSETLRNLSAKKKYDFYSRFIGTKQKVLFENRVMNSGGTDYIEGWTNNYVRVRINNDVSLQNGISEVVLNNLNGIKSVESLISK